MMQVKLVLILQSKCLSIKLFSLVFNHGFMLYQVSHTLFWHRYFYLVHRLELQEAKRKQISSRATDAAAAATQEMVWEDGEWVEQYEVWKDGA